MKKLINDPYAFVDEMLDGIVRAHSDQLKLVGPDKRAVVRADAPVEGKVAIVTGGGSGHLPVFMGYVGKGLAEGLASAVEAARAGVRATIEMKSRSGRGSWIAERTVGHQDPGATAILLMLEALSDFAAAAQD